MQLFDEPPELIVKENTMEAFDAFYGCDEYIAANYLNFERLELYDIVAERCVAVTPWPNTVIDVGCGTGHALLALRRRMISYPPTLTGIDFSAVAIDRARALLPEASFVTGDLYSIKPPAGAYDLVLCLETLEHVISPDVALVALLRLCAPGGRVVLTVPNGDIDHWDGHRSFWSPVEFEAWLRPHGLVHLNRIQGDTVLLAELAKG
jgi:SAM-dependent methyltransferase